MKEPQICKRCCDGAFSFYCTNCQYAVPRETKHFTPKQLEAHERKIWKAASDAMSKFLDDCDRYPIGLGGVKLFTYDDYKKSLKDA